MPTCRSSSRSHRSIGHPERRRSPRPPPTPQQSTQRTIVYLHDASSSKHQDERVHRRSKSQSRHGSRASDDRTAPSSKNEQQVQSHSDSKRSASPMTVPFDQRRPTFASTIESVKEETVSAPPEHIPPVSVPQSSERVEETNGKKRKKHHHHHHHHKKHRHHPSSSPTSRSKKHHRSEEDGEPTSVVQA